MFKDDDRTRGKYSQRKNKKRNKNKNTNIREREKKGARGKTRKMTAKGEKKECLRKNKNEVPHKADTCHRPSGQPSRESERLA